MAELGDNSCPSFLADLPEEPILMIIEELDMGSTISLSRTSKQFQRLANPANPLRHNNLQRFLVEAQSFPR
jgi:hypothetical protein